jgi:hypothetical protein
MPSLRNAITAVVLLGLALAGIPACGGDDEERSVCGNGRVEGREVCDGTLLEGQTCEDEGFLGGTLACADDCLSFDTLDCEDTCPTGEHECDGSCVDDDDPDHCGTECDPCPGDPHGEATCDGESCGIDCDSGYLLCEEACRECPSEGIDFVCEDDTCVAADCGDGTCEGTETCASCPADCGACEAEAIRLAGGSAPNEGVLIVQHDGVWLGVCDDGWSQTNTEVVCQELFGPGYTSDFESTYVAIDDFWLDSVSCDGTESSILDCDHGEWGTESCSGSEHLWITCLDPTQTTGQGIRLAGGATPQQGILEVQYSDIWRGVCDDGWNQTNTEVVCQELFGASYTGTYMTTSGTSDRFWLSNVYCTGTEASLFDCTYSAWGSESCSSSEHLWISCVDNSAPPGYDIRLSGGIAATEGVLEVAYSEEWRGVCDDGWTSTNSDVVCQELFGAGYRASTTTTSYSTSSSEFWLSYVYCTGTETSLYDCTNDGWGNHSCGSTEHVWISCEDYSAPPGYEIRLSGGTAATEGVLEVAYSGEWRGVCDDGWTSTNSDVVCQELFGAGYRASTTTTSYSTSSSEFWLDNVSCNGTESSLQECSHNGWGSHNCSASEHVWITCVDSSQTTGQGIRLTGGSAPQEGILEVQYSDIWRGVCDDGWSQTDTDVVCRELFGSSYTGMYETTTGTSSEFWLSYVYCTGTEASLFDCTHDGWGNHSCSASEHLWITCIDSLQTTGQGIRLTGGSTPQEGILEVQYSEIWRGVCDDGWTDTNSDVVCRELFGSAYTGQYMTTTGTSDRFWLSYVSCTGTETSLFDCSNGGWGNHACSSSEHVWISCVENSAPPGYDIRLSGGTVETEGVLEVAYSEEWRGVCDDGWTDTNSDVVCQELFGAGYTASTTTSYTTSSDEFWLDDVSCTGTETSLEQCSHSGWGVENCGTSEHVWITCTPT